MLPRALRLLLASAVVALPIALAASVSAEPGEMPRPPDDARVQALGAALFDAIVHDEPPRAGADFFPREPFLKIKAMREPGRYWDRLHKRFVADIHELHDKTPDLAKARFDRLALNKRGGLVKPGEEGNRLPYWASRHSKLYYRVGEEQRSFEVRVLISWQDRWYVIHLSEFK